MQHCRAALQYLKEDKWHKAHEIVQEYRDKHSCLIHGYLHYLEGDLSNARYWYSLADEKFPSLEEIDNHLSYIEDLVKK